MKFILGMIVALLLIAVIGAFVMYSGVISVAASSGEKSNRDEESVLDELLESAMEASVEHHAGNITVPKLDDPAMRKIGFEHYDAMCATCHGAPGVRRAEFAHGLNPHPPSLVTVLDEWSPAELFWITKHGVMMTGMPAFGPTHTDDEIWAIIAFLQTLPDLTPQQYLAMRPQPEDTTATQDEHEEHEEHEHHHSH